MIKRLRRRMTLVVIAVLILVSAGIVLAIHLANERSIADQAASTLSVLAESSGSRPAGRPENDGREGLPSRTSDNGGPQNRKNQRGGRGQPPELRSGSETAAGLSNSYTITLNDDGTVASWTSDRTDLYSDLQISAMAEGVQAHTDEIDGRLKPFLRGWTLERVTRVDLAILRLATYELLLGKEPTGVVINEAVELANQYSTDKAGGFINGVLGNLGRALDETEAPRDDA